MWWRGAALPSGADRARVALMGVFGTAGYLGCAWLALLGALSQAIGILCFAPARGRVDAWMANLGQSIVTAVVLLPVALLLEPAPSATLAPAPLLALIWSVLVVGVAGYALFFVMLRRLPASTAAALQLLSPPLAALFGWVLLREQLLVSDLLGGAITLAGIALLLRCNGRKEGRGR